MTTLFWSVLLAAAVLWPSRLAGPLDGMPLDQPAEVIGLALLIACIAATRGVLTGRWFRVLVVLLLGWKAMTTVAATQDGLCLRFISPVPLYRDDVRVPHSWDVRADWRSDVPRCSAVMTRDYPDLEYFPAWFFNLPPADPGRQSTPAERPPNVQVAMRLDGYLRASSPARLQVNAAENVQARLRVGERAITPDELAQGIDVPAGVHHVVLDGDLVRSQWSLAIRLNDGEVWSKGVLTLSPPGTLDRWLRPWGNVVAAALSISLLVVVMIQFARTLGVWAPAVAAASIALLLAGWTQHDPIARIAPLALLAMVFRMPPSRLQTVRGAIALLVVPWMALWLRRAIAQVGVFTWYSTGDDWWMLQRFAYRTYLQGHWLEGGEPTFRFQPLYRWIAGALHLVFGDSSVGELLWDAAAAGIGALFAFAVVKAIAGYRWGVVAAVTVLCTFTLGPAWHLFGRGLSEFSAAGLLYAAALLALAARRGHGLAAAGAGVAASFAMFARLNHIAMASAVAMLAVPFSIRAADIWRPSRWLPAASRPVLAGVLVAIAVAVWLFTARTYYYTGVPSMLYGTTAGHNSVWNGPPGLVPLAGRLLSSLLMQLTMSDSPQLEPRALLIVTGFFAACLGLLRLRPFGDLPMSLALLCVAGALGGFVARGTAYPGRFSLHLVPVCTAISVIMIAHAVSVLRRGRPLLPAQPEQAGALSAAREDPGLP